jgi:hypothetical protein
VVGDFVGRLEVTEDDPIPAITVTPIAGAVTEGESLRWRLALSAPAGIDLYLPVLFAAPPSGTELSTTDLPADWVLDNLFVDPQPSRPLSAADTSLEPVIPAGADHVDVEIPTFADGVTEGPEQLRLLVQWNDAEIEMTGTVVDGP